MSKIEELEQRYVRLFGEESVADEDVTAIESRLGIVLPQDFKQIARFYRGGFLGGKSHHAIATTGPATNVAEETERLRKTVGLPTRYVVLAEPPASLVVLETMGIASRVLWIDATDVRNLENVDSLRAPQVWPSYSSFFEYLLEQEESERSQI